MRGTATSHAILVTILLLGLCMSIAGIGWGLPSRRADRYLFGDQPAWTGARLLELKGADWSARDRVGADVDIDPVGRRDRPFDLAQDDRAKAELFIRYRLYTHQPDEASVMRALAGMRPARLQLDPKLYQYGGAFLYPVGAMIGLCSKLGLIEARADLAWTLDHPEAFGRLYGVARACSAAFGLLGIVACYAIARRLGGSFAGLLAALLFVLMPVVVTMSHEGKPHLPGAVLALSTALLAMKYDEVRTRSLWVWTCVLCGLSWGMVLGNWPVLAVLPAVALRHRHDGLAAALRRLACGGALAVLVFLLVNPYLVINTVVNRELLRSNLGASVEMYRVGEIHLGLVNVARLLLEGAGFTVGLTGGAAVVAYRVWRGVPSTKGGLSGQACEAPILPLVLPALLVLIQFICIGANKPGEYGRFLVYPAAVLAIFAAWGASRLGEKRPLLAATLAVILIVATGWKCGAYLYSFVGDTDQKGSRWTAAAWLAEELKRYPRTAIGLVREPAPYCVPAMDYMTHRVRLLPATPSMSEPWPDYIVATVDRFDSLDSAWWRKHYERVATFPVTPDCCCSTPTIISWADKPVVIFRRANQSLP